MWQVFGDISDASLAGVAALLVGVGTLFLVVRLPREVRALEEEAGAGPPLTRGQRLNVGLVMLVSQGLQVLVVSLAIGIFFVAFGLLAVRPHVLEAWIQTTGQHVGPRSLGLTVELLRVSAMIAALSGLYYAIAVLTDSTYREEFLEEITTELRDTFTARKEYLARLDTVGG
jgi:TRAP-type mannitol/chloroaromatic compound transport system permease large subunit